MDLWYTRFPAPPAGSISDKSRYSHIPQFLLEWGEHGFHWQATYGPVYAIKGCFGVNPRRVNFNR
jgi:hypothetical protein